MDMHGGKTVRNPTYMSPSIIAALKLVEIPVLLLTHYRAVNLDTAARTSLSVDLTT
jgi:hypothetical protein